MLGKSDSLHLTVREGPPEICPAVPSCYGIGRNVYVTFDGLGPGNPTFVAALGVKMSHADLHPSHGLTLTLYYV